MAGQGQVPDGAAPANNGALAQNAVPAPDQPLKVFIIAVAAQLREFSEIVWRKQGAWSDALVPATAGMRQRLLTACMVLPVTCNAAANLATAWAAELQDTDGSVPGKGEHLLDPAIRKSIESAPNFHDFWEKVHNYTRRVQDVLPAPENDPNTARNCALKALTAVISAGQNSTQLVTVEFDVPPPQRVTIIIRTPLEQVEDKLEELEDTIEKYVQMNWQFYRGLTGWGHVLTLLALLIGMATTAVGALIKSKPDSYAWLSIFVTALGVLHLALTTCATSLSPTSLAKPYMVANAQFKRLKMALVAAGSPSPQPTAAAPILPNVNPQPAPEEDQLGLLNIRYLKFKGEFDALRFLCPYVYLNADGRDAPEAPRYRYWLGIGRCLSGLLAIFEKLESTAPSPKNLPTSRT